MSATGGPAPTGAATTEVAPAAGGPAARARGSALLGRARAFDWREYVTYFGFVAIFLFFVVTLRDTGFLTTDNMLNITRQVAVIAVMAVAMTLVLSAGQIDLSVGSVAGLASVTTAMAIDNWGVAAGIAAGIATGLLVGSMNGWLLTKIGIPSFLVTLAMLGIARGAAQWISDTAAQPIRSDGYNTVFGGGELGPLPNLLLWMLVIGAVGHVVLRRTPFGRQVLASGGNEAAARFSGIDTRAIQRRVMILSGTAAALGGMLYAGRLESGRFQLGEGDELSVIAAVVLGGTSLFGGRGSVIGSVMGAVMIGMINNGLILLELDVSQQLIARGVIILLAVAAGQRE